MPDVSWISAEKLRGQPDDEERFIQVVPDFVAERRSSSDRLERLKTKMSDTWIANGEGFAGKSLSGEDVLDGFELPLDFMRRLGARLFGQKAFVQSRYFRPSKKN